MERARVAIVVLYFEMALSTGGQNALRHYGHCAMNCDIRSNTGMDCASGNTMKIGNQFNLKMKIENYLEYGFIERNTKMLGTVKEKTM